MRALCVPMSSGTVGSVRGEEQRWGRVRRVMEGWRRDVGHGPRDIRVYGGGGGGRPPGPSGGPPPPADPGGLLTAAATRRRLRALLLARAVPAAVPAAAVGRRRLAAPLPPIINTRYPWTCSADAAPSYPLAWTLFTVGRQSWNTRPHCPAARSLAPLDREVGQPSGGARYRLS